jgi:signal transduction histidine kinase
VREIRTSILDLHTAHESDLAEHALAALREGISNAVRHARTTAITVTVEVGGDLVIDVADDDGVGIPPDVARSGLHNLERRATTCGGSCVVTSRPAGGTRLTCGPD